MSLVLRPCAHDLRHPFSFVDFLNATPWGREVVVQVEEFWLCWLTRHQRPGFWLRLVDGTVGTIDVLGSRRNPITWDVDMGDVSFR